VKPEEDRKIYLEIFDEYREAMRKFSIDDLRGQANTLIGSFLCRQNTDGKEWHSQNS
jgi:hypothetical protein